MGRRGVSLLIAGSVALGGGLMAGPSACSTPSAGGIRGELMVAVSTDLVPNKDFTTIDVTVEHHGRVQLQESLPLGGGAGLPATIPITALAGDTDPFTVRIVASTSVVTDAGASTFARRIERDAITTVPEGRTALLYMPLQYLCDRMLDCPGGQTCIAGACASATIDVTTLPDYAYDKVFGPCLDIATCFEGASPASPTLSDCKLTGAPGSADNYALRLPVGSPGTCGLATCDVPLVEDPLLGWNGQQLPFKVCALLTSGGAQLVKSTKCPTMTVVIPTCQEEKNGDAGVHEAAPPVFVNSAPHQSTQFVVLGSNIFYLSADNAVVALDTSGAKPQSVVFQATSDVFAFRYGLATDGVDVAWALKAGGAWVSHGGQVIQLFDGLKNGALTRGVVMESGVVFYLKDGSAGNTVVQVNADGTKEAAVYTGTSAVATDNPQQVVFADGKAVFWLDNAGLVAAFIAKGTQSALAAVPFQQSDGFQVVGAGNMYWEETTTAGGKVRTVQELGGVGPADIATIPAGLQMGSQPPCSFAVDDKYLYYCDASGANVLRQPIAGGPSLSLAQLPGVVTNGNFSAIRLSSGKLYAQVNDKDGKSPGFVIVNLPQ
jgi:hypothetical protein